MNLGPHLTNHQQHELELLRARWMKSIFAIAPANRRKAEDGVRQTYRAAGVREPELLLWFDDLLGAAIAAEQLGPLVESNWMLPPKALEHRVRVQRMLRSRLGMRTWRQVMKAVGPQHTRSRVSGDKPSSQLVFPLFERDYSFGFLARHEFLSKTCGVRSSLKYAGLSKTAHNCSAWWAFTNAAILAERPCELHLDGAGRLHNTDGPAIKYRSDLQLYAEHGSFRLPADSTPG
jgi:hypothetical protein